MTHTKDILFTGSAAGEGKKALIMLHGRGGSAEDILSLADYFSLKDFTLAVPRATNNSWYPFSFMAPVQQNEPWLSSALDLLDTLTSDLIGQGIAKHHIYFLGFSQGACLTLEFVARHADRYGGIIAFTGGLIGNSIQLQNYKGDFQQTPVFIGTSDPDPHVPVERVYASSNILKSMNALVTEKVYAHMGHTINQDEINYADQILTS